MASFRIDRRDITRGHNSFDDYPDGGIQAVSYGANLWDTRGLLSNMAPAVQRSVGLAPYMIGSGIAPLTGSDPQTFFYGGMTRYLPDVYDGVQTIKFYAQSGDGFVFQLGDSLADVMAATSYPVFYQGYFYVPTLDDLVRIAANLIDVYDGTYLKHFWTVTKAQAALAYANPHPMVVYGDILYIAGGRYLHQLDGATATSQVFDAPTTHSITELANYNELIYIATDSYWNFTKRYRTHGKMYTWDGYSKSWTSEKNLFDSVISMYPHNGILFMWTRDYMGYWDGNRFVPMRKTTTPVYRKHIFELDQNLCYFDNGMIIRYGPIVPGGKAVFVNTHPVYAGTNPVVPGFEAFSANSVTNQVTYTRSPVNLVDVTSSSYSLQSFNSRPVDSSTGVSYRYNFNTRFFSRQVRFRKVVLEMAGLPPNGFIRVGYINDKGINKEVDVISVVGTTRKEFTINSEAFLSATPWIEVGNGARFRAAEFFYDASESPITK